MISVDRTISLFDKTELKRFTSFLEECKDEKLSQLLNLLKSVEPPSDEELMNRLECPNMNAVYNLRSRMKERASAFIARDQGEKDAAAEGETGVLVANAKFYIRHGAYPEAAECLEEAEKLAKVEHNKDLLNRIYNLQMTNGDVLEVDIDLLRPKWIASKEDFNRNNEINVAYADVRQQQKQHKEVGTSFVPSLVIDKILANFTLTFTAMIDPEFMFRLVELIRSIIVSSKDYSGFEPYLSRVYYVLQRRKVFKGEFTDYKTRFLYMLAHTCYRIREFEKAEAWLAELEEILSAPGMRTHVVYTKFISLKAAVTFYSGRNEEAIAQLVDALKDDTLEIPPVEKYNILLNLSVYYFDVEDYREANKRMLQITGTELRMERMMGKEWCMKRRMIEALIQYELGNDTIAINKIDAVRTRFAALFTQNIYKRVDVYLVFVLRYMRNPDKVTTPEFREELKAAQLGIDYANEDIQAIHFFCWLLSKMEKKTCYQALLERMKWAA